MFSVGPWFHAGMLILWILIWPFLFPINETNMWMLVVVNTGTLAFSWWSCNSSTLSYFEGLEIISTRFMTGCANISLLITFPVLLAAYFMSIIISIKSLSNGKSFAEESWIRLVIKWSRSDESV